MIVLGSRAIRFSYPESWNASVKLYEAKGDRAKAISYDQRFVNLWKDADPELQPRVAVARARIAKLRDLKIQ